MANKVLELSTNDLRRIRADAAQIQAAVVAVKPGELRHVEIPYSALFRQKAGCDPIEHGASHRN